MNIKKFHEAAEAGLTRTVQAMLKSGVPVDVADDDGRTALHRVYGRNPKSPMSRLLLKAGADPHRPDRFGSTPHSEAELAGTLRPGKEAAPPLPRLPRAKPWKGKRQPLQLREFVRWTPVLGMFLLLVYFVMHPPTMQFSSQVQPYVPIWPKNWANAQRAWNDKQWESAAAYCQAALDCDRKFDAEKVPVKVMAIKAYAQAGQPEKARAIYKTLPFLGWAQQNELQKMIAAAAETRLSSILEKANAARSRSERITAESLVHSAELFCKEMRLSNARVSVLKQQLAADKAKADAVLYARRQESARKRQQERLRRRGYYYDNSYRYSYSYQPERKYVRSSDGTRYPQAMPPYWPGSDSRVPALPSSYNRVPTFPSSYNSYRRY